jgi:hypothetical protein
MMERGSRDGFLFLGYVQHEYQLFKSNHTRINRIIYSSLAVVCTLYLRHDVFTTYSCFLKNLPAQLAKLPTILTEGNLNMYFSFLIPHLSLVSFCPILVPFYILSRNVYFVNRSREPQFFLSR